MNPVHDKTLMGMRYIPLHSQLQYGVVVVVSFTLGTIYYKANSSGIHSAGSLVWTRDDLDGANGRQISRPCWESNSDSSIVLYVERTLYCLGYPSSDGKKLRQTKQEWRSEDKHGVQDAQAKSSDVFTPVTDGRKWSALRLLRLNSDMRRHTNQSVG